MLKARFQCSLLLVLVHAYYPEIIMKVFFSTLHYDCNKKVYNVLNQNLKEMSPATMPWLTKESIRMRHERLSKVT